MGREKALTEQNGVLAGIVPSIDLKRQALTPLVMSIRTLALACGIAETHTLTRIEAVVEHKAMPSDMAEAVANAYDLIMLLKIRQNFSHKTHEPSINNRLQIRHLNPLQRSFLYETLKTIYELQEYVYDKFGGPTVG